MEKERAFNFKLLVPPRISTGQVSAVKPQEITEGNMSFMQPLCAANIFSKCVDKEMNMQFANPNIMATSKSVKTDASRKIAVMPMEKEKNASKSRDFYSELFEEAEKIKCWKVKMELEIAQKDRKLQENKRTIENQRKAIQELQFGSESLSMKLEEKMTENSDLKNKSNATRNLCNILKDAFERSAEKMNLYESERQETHHLFMQNSDTIQGIITAFDSLRVQVEVDRREMLKLKEEIQAYEDIKQRFQSEFRNKQEEVIVLQAKINDKENKLQEILQNFKDAEHNCIRFQEAARQHCAMLEASKQEREELFEKLQRAEQSNKESLGNIQALKTALDQKETEYFKVLAEKESCLSELHKLKGEEEETFTELQSAALELQKSLQYEMERSKQLEDSLSSVTEELKRTSGKLGEAEQQKDKKEKQMRILKEDMDIKAESITLLQEKLQMEETKASQLALDVQSKKAEIFQLQNTVQIQTLEKKHAENTLETLQKEMKNLKGTVQAKEAELSAMTEKLSNALRNDGKSAEEINLLKKTVENYEKTNKALIASFKKLQIQNETVAQQTPDNASGAQVLEVYLQESIANEKKTKKEIKRLEEENYKLRQDSFYEEKKTLKEKYETSIQSLKKEVIKKEKLLKSFEMKLNTAKAKIENKTKAQEECLKEKRNLTKQLATENEKCHKLKNEVNEIKEQLIKTNILNKEKLKKLQEDIEIKTETEAELQKKVVEKLTLEASDAAKSKEEMEFKCQKKISNMVSLMEKHKNQYDKMVEEKDAELNKTRKKEAEINSNNTSLACEILAELDLSEMKKENSHLKQQLQNESKERNELKQEIKALKIKMESMHKGLDKKVSEQSCKEIKCTASQNTASFKSLKRSVFGFSKETENESVNKTPSLSSVNKRLSSTPQMKVGKEKKRFKKILINPVFILPKQSGTEILKTPNWSSIKKTSTHIKSYRIRTPPSTGKGMPWKKSTLELDPKSDSSEQNDLLSFSIEPLRSVPRGDSGPQHQYGNPYKKLHFCFVMLSQSSAVTKNPRTALKLAAVKRMRDAGWTAVTSTDKKKMKTENIFA
ncbi:synaptonemal complex protein 1 [Arapaima gigas]